MHSADDVDFVTLTRRNDPGIQEVINRYLLHKQCWIPPWLHNLWSHRFHFSCSCRHLPRTATHLPPQHLC